VEVLEHDVFLMY